MALKKEKPDLLGDELVAEEEEKNWKGICIAFVVISSIVSMIITAIIFLTPDDGDSRYKHAKLTLQDIVNGKNLLDNQFDGRWITNTELVYRTSDGNVISYNAFNNNTQLLVSNITMKQYQVQKYSFSADRKYVLFVTDIKPVFHYSHTAQYKIFNITDQQVYNLEAPGGDQTLQHAEWGTKGSQLLFIYENNIYYLHSVGELIQQITKSGSISNGISHGLTDFLYGERILKSNKVIHWSPDGSRLCFATFDDSKVDQVQYPKYGDYRDNSNSYPKMSNLRFPKVGSYNPTVELWVVELNQQRLSSMASANRVLPPREMMISEESEYYLNSIVWIDNQRFASIWMNRYQNYSVLSLCTEKHAWICERHLEEHSDSLGFVDILDPPLITNDKRHYLIRLPMNHEHGTYKQIAMVTINGRVKNFLTQGNCDVVKILAHKQETRTVYYLGKLPSNSMQQHLFSIPDILSSQPRMPTCLTCSQNDDQAPLEHHIQRPRHSFLSSEYLDTDQILTQPKPNSIDDLPLFSAAVTDNDNGPSIDVEDNELINAHNRKDIKQTKESSHLIKRNCTFHDALFSVFSDYYVLKCLGPASVFSEIRTVDGNQIVLRIEPNEKLEELVQRRAYPQIRNMRIALDHNCYADAQIYLSPNIKENEHFRFPLVIQVLPTDAHSSQLQDQVTTRLDFNLPVYLASNRNTVTVRLQLHVMQSIANGERRPRLASSKIFGPNSLTQLLQSAVAQLKHRLPFINEDRTGMIGVAAGAYLIGQLASQRNNQFNCSVLVAPIVNWLFVDSFTGEKLFGQPWIEGNLVAYERADLSKKVAQFKSQNLFILHGTADDEVHLQHSFVLMKALNEEGVLYRSQIYPDANHYLEDVQLHLFQSIESFLVNKLKIEDLNDFPQYETFNMKMKSFKPN